MRAVSIERNQQAPSGAVFWHRGRPLKIVRSYGTDARAPVIVEELATFGSTLTGQYALWSCKAVLSCLAGATGRAIEKRKK